MMLVMMLMAMASPNPLAINASRKAYSTCLKAFETQSLGAKMDAEAYAAAVKAACPAEAAALTRALVDFDVAMGGKRASAAENAQSDVASYVETAQERFRDLQPAGSRPAFAAAPATAPANVTPAAATK